MNAEAATIDAAHPAYPDYCLAMPEKVASRPDWQSEILNAEELTELDWLAPLLEHKEVIELGCGLGYRSAYIASMTRRLVSHDTCNHRANLAEELAALNNASNMVVARNLDPEDLGLADVLLVNTIRPLDAMHVDQIEKRPAMTAIVLGPLSREMALKFLEAGYQHCAKYNRGTVFTCLEV